MAPLARSTFWSLPFLPPFGAQVPLREGPTRKLTPPRPPHTHFSLWRAGPACEVHTLGACRTSNSSKALVFYGILHRKSCACWRQLAKFGYNKARRAFYLNSLGPKWGAWG